jgi:hypothetical protein
MAIVAFLFLDWVLVLAARTCVSAMHLALPFLLILVLVTSAMAHVLLTLALAPLLETNASI